MPIRTVAPEVFASGGFTSAADVWAFGVLIYEIFWNGQEPYLGWSGSRIKAEVCSPTGYRLSVPSWAPPYVHFVQAECFKFDPRQRAKMSHIVKLLNHLKQ